MEPLLGDLLGRTDDADYLVTLHKMELPGYTFFEGVSVPSKRDMNILKAARQREKPKTHGNFTIWRNPDSQFSTLARGYMNSGAASLLVYIAKTPNRDFLEPRIVRYEAKDKPTNEPTNEQSEVFVIGTPSDKECGLVMMFRPLDKPLRSDDGFFEIYPGSHEWSLPKIDEWFRQYHSEAPGESKWDPVTVDFNQVLLVHAGTLVRFGRSSTPCDFVCMGYSDDQADFGRRDIKFEQYVVPFLRRVPDALRERILSRPPRGE
ncbi:hypothetical protein BDV24DRAFT_167258 [Aspergillus arachidicola]|uniref:Uncharacterized protein n=1 Tax=Aspergillus arachidicola TaxID=656916 RepID=A0A5N6XYN2_9EURO|nr:hypothetical protein BDV24DRAFT_167258 [Aspergillus arachidicola]